MKAKYKGVPGDSKVVEMFGLTFFEGQDVDVSDLPAEQVRRIASNPHFAVSGQAPATQAATDAVKRRGRPPRNRVESGLIGEVE